MKNRTLTAFIAVPWALLLACGVAQAQLKVPANLQPKDGLGSGIGAQSLPPTPASTPSAASPVTPAPGGVAKPAAATPADDKASADDVIQEIANCVMAGLPPDWTLAQIEVTELGRTDKQREFEAIFSYKDGAGRAGPFVPCDPREPALNVYKLNGALEPAKRNWIRATLVFSKEGKFELQYDYADKDAQKGASPARADDVKKDAKKSEKKK